METPPLEDVSPHDKILMAAQTELKELCDRCRMADTHGLVHATQVLTHVCEAFTSAVPWCPVKPPQVLGIKLAALLCNCDKRDFMEVPPDPLPVDPDDVYRWKTSPTTEEFVSRSDYGRPNAMAILKKVLGEGADHQAVIVTAIAAMNYVSTHENGDHLPDETRFMPEIMWPRWAHRLECVGDAGIVRAEKIAERYGVPLFLPATAAPASAEEVWKNIGGLNVMMTNLELHLAQRTKQKSPSLVDHVFARLLPSLVPILHSRNPYLVAAAQQRIQPLEEICLAPRPDGVRARIAKAGRIMAIGHSLKFFCSGATIRPRILEDILQKEKDKIRGHRGRAILYVTEKMEDESEDGSKPIAAGSIRLSCRYDTSPNQKRAIRDAVARAKNTSEDETKFVDQLLGLWDKYDHERGVLCMIQCGVVTQAVVVPKP